jgi:hypothetical protein
MKDNKIIVGILAVMLAFTGVIAFKTVSPSVGSADDYEITLKNFAGGIKVGRTGQFSVNSSGALTTSGAFTTSGAIIGTAGTTNTTGIFSSTVGVSTSSPSTTLAELSVGSTGTSTIYLGSAGTKGGGIQMANAAGTMYCLVIIGSTPTAVAGYCK